MAHPTHLHQILAEEGVEKDLAKQILDAAEKDPFGLLVVLRKRHRAKAARLTVAEQWKAIVRQPVNPSPELRAYLDRHAQRERERNRWQVEVKEERWQKWDEWERTLKWEDLHADQAILIETWLHEHDEQARELVSRRIGTQGQPLSGPLPSEAYHSSGLFWLTANILLKIYGFDDQVARPIIQRLESTWTQTRYDGDTVTMGCASGYTSTINQLSKDGAHHIRNFDHYLLRTVRNAIRKENKFVRKKKGHLEKQSMKCPSCGRCQIIPPAECPMCRCGVPEQLPIEVKVNEPHAPMLDSPDHALGFLQLIRSMPTHLQKYVEFLIMNDDGTADEAAAVLNCSIRTIERFRKELRTIIKL